MKHLAVLLIIAAVIFGAVDALGLALGKTSAHYWPFVWPVCFLCLAGIVRATENEAAKTEVAEVEKE